ncbi:MAG: hypothetical protein ABI643_03535 [Candidatus Doudnabacteria bacterium]
MKILRKIWNPFILTATILAFPAVSQAKLPLINPANGVLPGNATNPISFLFLIINTLLAIAGLLAVLFIIIGGFQYITSAGNEERAEAGRKTLVNAIIGIVIIILSFVIITVINNALG